MAVVTQRLISDGESSATVEIVITDEATAQTDTLIDLSTLRGAGAGTLRGRVSRIFYSIAAKPVSAVDAAVTTDNVVFLGWDTGGMADIIVPLPPGAGVINESFLPTSGATTGDVVYYVEPYTIVTLHVTIDKLTGFINSTKR